MTMTRAVVLAGLLGLAACGGGEVALRGPNPAVLRAVDRISDQDFAVPLEGGQAALLPVFSDRKLVDPHPGVKRVVIGMQDANRDAAGAFETLKRVAGEGGETMVVVPQFLAAQDTEKHGLGTDFARWTIEGWREGGNSRPSSPRDAGALVSSFGVFDALLLFLADRAGFPDLEEIVVAGNGPVARTVQLYAATGKGFGPVDAAGIRLRFVVAGADTFLYFDDRRPGRGPDGFETVPREQCAGYNQWPYGTVLPAVYAFGREGRDLAAAYAARDVTYLFNARESAALDRGCEARAQGGDRIERAQLYLRHLALMTGAPPASHRLAIARDAGAGAAGLFGSACGRAVLLGEGGC
jgi:hypothetical protein